MFGLSQIQMIIAGAALAVLLIGGAVGYIYHKGETSGSAAVTTAVEKATIDATTSARKDKDNADAKVNSMPRDAVIDGTR